MDMQMNRRAFMMGVAAAGAVTGMPRFGVAQEGGGACAFRTTLYKALIAGVADDKTCERIAKAGFPGVELSNKNVTEEQAIQGRLTAAKHGLAIHSFMGGWTNFNSSDEAQRRKAIEDVKRMIRLTATYGSSVILLVPCRVGGTMPKPSQFRIAFDPRTLRVTSVVEGDNAPFAEYIAAQNQATEMSRRAIEELIPVAAREGVIIALENVWNNLWVLPDFAAAFVRSFDNPWVKAYFDLGNNVRYAPTEEWLRALGSQIVKLHIKDFKIDREKKNEGDFVPIGKGSVDWRSVRKVIDEIGYNGWVTIESRGFTDAEHSALMDRFFAGQGA
ncbi:MAG TPA: sugar phosphate isomerase/epimerase family protein [Kiritimatiellia bacterium]|nr:sugar phosphate isomerase/epimerase family protein [Kiritimatiellia bacterium]HOR96800.1 sugar phosphate isomerase/epimerase family protein [Kiritimatiellia bacterium]